MYYRFDNDETDEVGYVPVCPFFQNLYRQFPISPMPGGMIGPPGFGPGLGYPGVTPGYGPPGGVPPFFDDFGGDQGFGPPSGPPPAVTPAKTQAGIGIQAVDPGSLRRCRYRFVYLWLDNGRSFWIWLNYVGRRSISGWRWSGRRWVYFGIDTRRIDSFVCY